MATPISPTPPPVVYVPAAPPLTTQVHLLNQQGENPSEIAAILGLSVATVDGDLGIAAPGGPTTPVAAQTPPAQSGPAQPVLSIFA